MRIDRVEIDGFGKLNHVALSFSDGFNLIVGDNESGKSTLCEFLLAMFYDMPNVGRKKSLCQSARKKYRPWTGSSFGGRVFFTDKGTQYVLEKSFGETEKFDRAKLMFADTWEPAGEAKNAGERFFGLGREGFLKTLYIRNVENDTELDAEEIMTRLSNMETGVDEDISYDKIKSAMEDAHAKILTKTGRGGSLFHLREDAHRLEGEIHFLEKKRETLLELEKQIAELNDTVADLQKQKKQAEEVLKVAREYEAYQSAQQTVQSRQVMEERYQAECVRLEEAKKQIETLQKLSLKEIPEDVLANAETLEKELLLAESMSKSPSKRKGFKGLPIMLIFGVIAGIALAFWHIAAGIGIFCAVLLAALILLFRKNREKDIISYKKEALEQELSAVCEMYGADSLSMLRKMAQERELAKVQLLQLEQEVARLEQDTKDLKSTILKIQVPDMEVAKVTEPYTGEPSPALEEKIHFLTEKQKTAENTLQDLRVELATETAGEKSVAEAMSELLSLQENIRMLEFQEAALSKAQEWFERAHQEIKENFAPLLNQRSGEIFMDLTDGTYKEVRIGEGFSLRCKGEDGVIAEADALSSGTCDLLYISMRLATLAVLFSEKVPPIFSDDAFSRMDDARHRKIAAYLRDASCFGQVLSFTCRREGNPMINDKNINLIDLNKEGVLEHGLQN